MGLRTRHKEIHKDRIYLGKLLKPHGLQGEMKFTPFGSDPWLLEEFARIHLESPDGVIEIEQVRGTGKAPIVKIKGVNDRTASEALCGALVWVEEKQLPALEEDMYYESDILYARVVTMSGEDLGQVQDIIETGERDVLVVRDEQGNEKMIPATLEFVKEVNKEEAIIRVDPPEFVE